MTSRLAITTALAMFAGSASAQNFFYTYAGHSGFPSITETETSPGSGEFEITVGMPLLPGTTVASFGVRPATANRKIRYLRVGATGGTSSAYCFVTVNCPDLPSWYISRVDEITRVAGARPIVMPA